MKTEKLLKEIKKEYLLLSPREEFITNGWRQLREEIERREAEAFYKRPLFLAKWVVIGIAILFGIATTAGVAAVASQAVPGHPLYPLKKFAEDSLSSVFNKPQLKLQNRAQEIEDVAKKNNSGSSAILKEAVQNYSQTVKEENGREKQKGGVNNQDSKQELKSVLKDQEDKFRKLQKDIPAARQELEKAINSAKEGQAKKADEKKEEKLEEKVFKEEDKAVKGVEDKKDNLLLH